MEILNIHSFYYLKVNFLKREVYTQEKDNELLFNLLIEMFTDNMVYFPFDKMYFSDSGPAIWANGGWRINGLQVKNDGAT